VKVGPKRPEKARRFLILKEPVGGNKQSVRNASLGGRQNVSTLSNGRPLKGLRAAAAFQAKARSDHQAEKDRIEFLERKIQRKDEVLAELMSEHIALKKELGEL
jgi:hypothetical protein